MGLWNPFFFTTGRWPSFPFSSIFTAILLLSSSSWNRLPSSSILLPSSCFFFVALRHQQVSIKEHNIISGWSKYKAFFLPIYFCVISLLSVYFIFVLNCFCVRKFAKVFSLYLLVCMNIRFFSLFHFIFSLQRVVSFNIFWYFFWFCFMPCLTVLWVFSVCIWVFFICFMPCFNFMPCWFCFNFFVYRVWSMSMSKYEYRWFFY